MPKVWVVTGVSGSGRIELLNNLQTFAKGKGKNVKVIDVGKVIEKKARENQIKFVLSRILNLDRETLSLLRVLAMQTINQELSTDQDSDIIFIGMHALFLWKDHLIPGVSYSDLLSVNLDGIITVVDDVITIQEVNGKNQKWAEEKLPSPASLQRWMMEEELLSDVFASIKGVQMFVLAKNQKVENLYKFFFEDTKRIYLSYPITAIREEGILDIIQNEYKPRLEERFYVFNPLDIMDKTHVSKSVNTVEGFLEKESVNLVDARTIERDYRFISQSDAVVVIYPTDKLSPGVSAEMHYAHAHQIPVFMYFPGTPSPFLTEIANIYKDKQAFFEVLDKFSTQKEYDNLIQ